jgi:hypothetical protein
VLWLSPYFRTLLFEVRQPALPDLFRPDRRIAARAAGRRNDRHIARLRRWCANFRVNSCGRAEHTVGSCQLVAERLRPRVGGRGALRRDGALLRYRLRRRATRRIPRGRWRGRLSRWRRWRRRSLSGRRAGPRQSCHDQKKRFFLHGEQMLPRYRCSLLAGKRLADSVYRPSGFGFRGSRAWTASRPQNVPAAIMESWRGASPSGIPSFAEMFD